MKQFLFWLGIAVASQLSGYAGHPETLAGARIVFVAPNGSLQSIVFMRDSMEQSFGYLNETTGERGPVSIPFDASSITLYGPPDAKDAKVFALSWTSSAGGSYVCTAVVGPSRTEGTFAITTAPLSGPTFRLHFSPPRDGSPRPQRIIAGDPLHLKAEIEAAGTLKYQWMKDGRCIPGASGLAQEASRTQQGRDGVVAVIKHFTVNYDIPNAALADAGVYRLIVSNDVHDLVSLPTMVWVSAQTSPHQ